MAIRSLRWTADVCQCVINLTYDDSVSDTQRTFTPVSYDNRCPAHASMSNVDTLNTTVAEESRRRNWSLDTILFNSPTTVYDIIDAILGIRNLKPTVEYVTSWSGTAPNRVLTVSLTGVTLTNTQKNTIRSALNTRFGTGKVLMP